MGKNTERYTIVMSILFLIMLPNALFVYLGEDSAVFTVSKQIVFFVYSLSLVVFPLCFLKPKILFVLIVPFLPFALIDLYVLSITNTQSTAMHYYSFFATNSNEAKELVGGSVGFVLGSIFYIALFVFLLYKLKFSFRINRKIRLCIGIGSLLVIMILLVRDFKIAMTLSRSNVLDNTVNLFFVKVDKTFPIGSMSKLKNVYDDLKEVNEFNDKNKGFSYKPVLVNQDEKTIVLILGETARKKNFQIYGYSRENNPNLIKEHDLISFTNVTTCANFTLSSVAQIMSSVGPVNYKDIYNELGLMAAFKESGYKTYWITNQDYSLGSIFSLYSKSADVFKDVSTTLDMAGNDLKTLPVFDDIIKDGNKRRFIVIHSAGSHYRYNLRYPKEFARYKPELDNNIGVADNGVEFKSRYLNSYDNTILLTDYFLSEIIKKLKINKEQSIMMYLSDHGENLYDDKRQLFAHGTSMPSIYELEIPMFIWCSVNIDQNIVNRLNKVKGKKLNSEIVFHTLSDLGGFKTKLHNLKFDLLSDSLMFGKRTFLKSDGSVMEID